MVKFSGFATLGAIYNDSEELGFHSNYKVAGKTGFSLAPDSLIGTQANIKFNPQWDAVVQAVFRDKLDDKVLNYIDVGFLRYSLAKRWEFRAGRMNTDIYFLSEYRSVGYAYPWARPPSEFYAHVSTVSQFQGADVLYKRSVGEGFLQVKLAFGETEAVIGRPGTKVDVKFDDMLMASISYQQNKWQVRASFLDAKIQEFGDDQDLAVLDQAIEQFPPYIWPGGPVLKERFDYHGKKQQFYGLGYQYDNDPWIVQLEIGASHSLWDIIQDNVSGYVSLGYQAEDITYFSILSAIEPTGGTLSDSIGEISPAAPAEIVAILKSFEPLLREQLNQSRIKQHTFGVGAKWQVSPTMIAKLQVDRSVVADNGFALWQVNTQPDSSQTVNVVSLNVNWIF
ncbi:hypothetical protein [Paraglaciecola sp. L3A3]|uniref:hypothetical protein n=1 Tax=Paraglaciecola sp. L3A3 TaxID=2686358 RepID=UPI001E5E0F88|nr:hypothetical protein [Paraglaciecola sp. L3A3]